MQAQKDSDFLGAMRRRWVLVLSLTVLGAAIGLGASRVMSPVYEGTASLIVGDFTSSSVSNDEIQAMQSLTATYADIAQREPVLSRAARQVGMADDWRALNTAVTVQVPKESPQVIQITVDGGSRAEVIAIARAVAQRLVRYVDGMSSGDDFISPQLRRIEEDITAADRRVDQLVAQERAEGAGAPSSLHRQITRTQADIAQWQTNYATLDQLAASSGHAAIRPLDGASAARTPVEPNVRFNLVGGAFAGLLLALAVSYLLESRRGPRPGGPATSPGPRLAAPPDPSTTTTPLQGRNGRRIPASSRTGEHPEGTG